MFNKLAMTRTSTPASLLPTEDEPSDSVIATSPPSMAWMPSEPPVVKTKVGSRLCFLNKPTSLATINTAWYGLVAV